MNEYQFKLEARLAAIEYMIMTMYSTQHRVLGTPVEAISYAHRNMIERLRNLGIPHVHPVESDAFLSEVEERVDLMLAGIEYQMGMEHRK